MLDRPILEHVLEAAATTVPKTEIFVATSGRAENASIRRMAGDFGVACYSGDEEDVASRFFGVLGDLSHADYFLRVCGDSPLYAPELLALGLQWAVDGGGELEIVTSMPNHGYPMGMNLELVSRRIFLDHYPRFHTRAHFEHVTRYFYERIGQFRHALVTCEVPGYQYSKYKFSVDTPEDLDRIRQVADRLGCSPFRSSLSAKFSAYDEVVAQR